MMYGILWFVFLGAMIYCGDAAAAESNARSARRQKRNFDNFVVYASEGKVHAPNFKMEGEHVELFRFVTPYRTGMEAMMDMTPFAPLIKAAVAADNLTMYTFIDTWVGNHTSRPIVYMNNVSKKCMLTSHSDGNGWGLTANLVFWAPEKGKPVSTQPREMVTLASGKRGGTTIPIGGIGFHEANISEGGSAVLLKKGADFTTVKTATVYDLSKEDAGIASLLGYVAQRTELLTRAGNQPEIDYLIQDVSETLLFSQLTQVSVTGIDKDKRQVYATYNGSELDWKEKMPVFFSPNAIFTDVNVGGGWWLNSSLPLKPVGALLEANGSHVTIQLDNHCLPSNASKMLPELLVPVSPTVLDRINATMQKVRAKGLAAAGVVAASTSRSSGDSSGSSRSSSSSETSNGGSKINEGGSNSGEGSINGDVTPEGDIMVLSRLSGKDGPLLLTDATSVESKSTLTDGDSRLTFLKPDATDLVSPPLLGHLELGAAADGGSDENTWHRLLLSKPIDPKANMPDGTTVAVLTQQHDGRLLHRDFELPNLVFGDKVILQLAVTGHGWASTQEQCGEYCHAVYKLSLNGNSAFNVTQFRDDCKDNPIDGKVQMGTWDESRNGWCPGTVVPGLFIDMTDHVQKHTNNISIDLVVWNNATLKYEPYTDYSGYAFNDHASLVVGMSAFVYDASAVEAISQQDQLYTAAEAAIKHGCSVPSRLQPPEFVKEPLEQQALLEMGSRQRSPHVKDFHRHHPNARHFMDFKGNSLVSMVPERPDAGRGLLRTEVHAGGHAQIHPHKHPDHRDPTTTAKEASKGRFHFENRAPWYLYNEKSKQELGDAQFVSLFDGELMQGNRRDIHVHIDHKKVPEDWSHVAIHFKLHEPPADLDMDHWDRLGSMGLIFGAPA